jgi:DNA-3-methyladenine glycosylase I
MPTRCGWVHDDPLEIAYHDQEWGVPLHDEQKLFEFLILEGFQAGLSWITILRKRENFRRAFYSLRKSRSIAFQKRGLQVACPPEEPISELGAGPQTP